MRDTNNERSWNRYPIKGAASKNTVKFSKSAFGMTPAQKGQNTKTRKEIHKDILNDIYAVWYMKKSLFDMYLYETK
jgi:hypothetical protein